MSVTISNSGPVRSSARLTFVLALLLTTLLGCKEDEHDWCVEAHDEQAVRVSGTLAVEYAGTWGQAPDGFQPFAFMDRGGARVQGCAHDSKGALWRFRGVWQMPEGASLPLATVLSEPGEAEALFSGDLLICPTGDCSEREQEVVNTRGDILPEMGEQGGGSITDSKPEEMVFAASVTVKQKDEDPAVEVRVDVAAP